MPLDVIERSSGFLIFDGVPNKNKLIQNNPNNKFLNDFKFRKRTFADRPNKIKEIEKENSPQFVPPAAA